MIQKALPPGIVVFQEAPPRLADSEPEPDVAVVAGREADFKDRHPTTGCLVVEVAVSSAALERANAALYAEAGIAKYWIVLGREQKVEIYRLGPEGAYGLPQLISNGKCSIVPPFLGSRFRFPNYSSSRRCLHVGVWTCASLLPLTAI